MAKKKSSPRGIPHQTGATKQPSSAPVFPQGLQGFQPTNSAKKQQDMTSPRSRTT